MFETTNQFFNVQHHFQGDTTKNGASRADGINSVQSGHFSSSCWGKGMDKNQSAENKAFASAGSAKNDI